jgi:hypothetical protein
MKVCQSFSFIKSASNSLEEVGWTSHRCACSEGQVGGGKRGIAGAIP